MFVGGYAFCGCLYHVLVNGNHLSKKTCTNEVVVFVFYRVKVKVRTQDKLRTQDERNDFDL